MDAGPPPPPSLHMDMSLVPHRGLPPSPHHTDPRPPRMSAGVVCVSVGGRGGGGEKHRFPWTYTYMWSQTT
eukprot:13329-Eustigmatos_ZCMA.PRE.1